MAREPRFLSVEDVLAIHEDTILHEGGKAGLRDPGLLESAVMMPQQRYEDAYLHRTLGSKAAAYLYHLVQNHAFIDGNKRTGALAALVFLHVNGARRLPSPNALQAATLRVASGAMSKGELIRWMEQQVRRRKA